ncbi:MAG: hypothetical protein Q9M50_06955 [Methylococcales bacterium]|nr:hypothetical protein [Methylococcales bacterium]
MKSKAARLKEIFGTVGDKWKNVTPHFLMMSPRRPEKLNIENWPVWMAPQQKVKWLPLPITDNLNKVTRCNSDGKADKNGNYWTKKRR